MRNLWTCSLALLLGLLVTAARAQDGWRPPALRPVDPAEAAPVAQLGRPVADPAPVAVLERPVPAPAAGVVDAQVRPTVFRTDPPPDDALLRAQASGGNEVRPLPVGTPSEEQKLHGWRRATNSLASSGPALSAGPDVPPPAGGIATTPPLVPTPLVPTPAAPPAGGIAPGWPLPGPGPGSPIPGAPPGVGPAPFCPGNCCPGNCCPGNCCPDCCSPCPTDWFGGKGCCFNWRLWATAEYLLWWTKGSPLPPLVTAGSAGDTVPGALGQPGTQLLFGGNTLNTGPRSGVRGFVGYWLDDAHRLGFEVGGFWLGDTVNNFSASSLAGPGTTGIPIITRPFVNAATGAETVELVAAPNVLAGSVYVRNVSTLWGYEANALHALCCGCNYYVNVLAGFRALGLDDSLNVTESLAVLRPGGGTFLVNDHFATQNRFYGAQLGTYMQYQRGNWWVGLTSKLAMGPTQQMVNISGGTVIGTPGGSSAFPGGLLALPSNIGVHTRDTFTVIPEVGINLGYQFTPHIGAFVGYNFLYWSSVVRAGNQIDRAVNVNQLAPAIPGGPARPAFNFNGSDFWAQGIQFGIRFTY